MKRLIRKIIDWAYGKDIWLSLHMLDARTKNLSIIMRDYMQRRAVYEANMKMERPMTEEESFNP